jgi:hypothetical protein
VTFRILPEADGEAIAAGTWYDDQRPGLGDEFSTELSAAYLTIRRQIQWIPKLERYDGPHEIRRQLLNRFPYAVIVQVREKELLIIAVTHTRRQPFYWLDRLE